MSDYESVNWRLLLKVAADAGLSEDEIYQVREYVEVRRDPYDFVDELAHKKLHRHFVNTGEMPSATDELPGFWILDYFTEE